MMTRYEDDNYEVIMNEMCYWSTIQNFIDAGKAQGFYNVLCELNNELSLCDRPLFHRALLEFAKELNDNV